MDSIKDQLKKFITGSHDNHDVTYLHYFSKGEHMEFGITSKSGDDYFFVDSINRESSVRGYYKLPGMEEETTIVVDVTNIMDNSCEFMIRALDQMKFKVVVTADHKVKTCLL